MEELKLSLPRLAAERTPMGWIWTPFSMMAFGFTIYTVIQEFGRLNTGALAPQPEVHEACSGTTNSTLPST